MLYYIMGLLASISIFTEVYSSDLCQKTMESFNHNYKMPVSKRNEIFEVKQEKVSYDIEKAVELIRSGKIEFSIENLEPRLYVRDHILIEDYQGVQNIKKEKFITKISKKDLDSHPDSMLDVPGIAIEHPFLGFMLIDGNKRITKLYLNGSKSMTVYVIPRHEIYKITIQQKESPEKKYFIDGRHYNIPYSKEFRPNFAY